MLRKTVFSISMKSLDSMEPLLRLYDRTQDRDDEMKKERIRFCPINSGTMDGNLENRIADFMFLSRREEWTMYKDFFPQ